jgi:inosine-uridine nucleoside N-ribohydrolase
MRRAAAAWLLVLALAACAAPAAPRGTATPFTGTPRAVIVDTDMAPDDWRAIHYLLRRQDIAVRAITVVGTGEAHCGPGVQTALGLAALAGQPNIPVACGRETPLAGGHAFPDEWRASADAALGLKPPKNPNGPAPQSAPALIQAAVAAAPGKPALLTLGPLTNVADALQAAPELTSRLAIIYVMGGAVDVPGNNPAASAEWNFYADPRAAAIVLRSGASITLVPLDATNQVPVTLGFYNRLKADHATPEAQFVFDSLTEQKDFIDSAGYDFWDSLTAAILADESLATFSTHNLAVMEAEGPDSARVIGQPGGPAVRYAVTADKARFEQAFLDSLNAVWQ